MAAQPARCLRPGRGDCVIAETASETPTIVSDEFDGCSLLRIGGIL